MHEEFMRQALLLARRGYGTTSPNPMVGALLVKGGSVIGRGWHRAAGQSHAEIEALRDAQRRGQNPRGATLYVTLEPCCTHGRTPPCTDAIIQARLRRVVVGATDPNPRHSGKAYGILRRAGLDVLPGILAEPCEDLNEAFNYWIVRHTPLVTVKAAMTLDGKIATAAGESKWITGERARAYGMRLRAGSDAILVGINTVLTDNPSLNVRLPGVSGSSCKRRIILDALARTPLSAKVVNDEYARLTTVVATESAPRKRMSELGRKVHLLVAPEQPDQKKTRCPTGKYPGHVDLNWLLQKLGEEEVTSLLVEGGGEVNASFLLNRLAHRVAFFYAPKILGGRLSRRSVAGIGAASLAETRDLIELKWRRLGEDWLLRGKLVPSGEGAQNRK